MGTTFVSASDGARGFWMHDAVLELWLRLLVLHLPDPTDDAAEGTISTLRDQWLLASRGLFVGCVPHGLEAACATDEGRAQVRAAITSLLASLDETDAPLDPTTLNLLGIEGRFTKPIERQGLVDVGHALMDLLDGAFGEEASSAELIPGSTPYARRVSPRRT